VYSGAKFCSNSKFGKLLCNREEGGQKWSFYIFKDIARLIQLGDFAASYLKLGATGRERPVKIDMSVGIEKFGS